MTDDCVRWGKKKRKFRPESVYETMLSQSVDVKPEPLHYPAWEIFVGSAAPDRTTARRWEKIGPSFTSMRSFPLHFHRVRLCFPFTCFFSLTNVFFGFIDFLLFQPKWMNIPAASFKYFDILRIFDQILIWRKFEKIERNERTWSVEMFASFDLIIPLRRHVNLSVIVCVWPGNKIHAARIFRSGWREFSLGRKGVIVWPVNFFVSIVSVHFFPIHLISPKLP